jgi:hypothetical protein
MNQRLKTCDKLIQRFTNLPSCDWETEGVMEAAAEAAGSVVILRYPD